MTNLMLIALLLVAIVSGAVVIFSIVFAVQVQSGATIALGQRAEWNIRIEENDSGGAVASIQSSFTVIN